MAARSSDHYLPLSALLSQVFVAFTIECDNEFEHQMPHRTASSSAPSDALYAPWLISLAMWATSLRFIPEQGITVKELERLARTPTNLDGMRRWGYITLKPDPNDSRAKPPQRDWLIRVTPAGQHAQEIWRPLLGEIEGRWRERFGEEAMRQLYDALWAVVRQFDVELPECLPILAYGLFSRGRSSEFQKVTDHAQSDTTNLTLYARLSQTLLAFALVFEHQRPVSLAISADVLRVLGEEPVLIHDLPALSGVSKEAITMATGFLQKKDYAIIEPAPGRGKRIRLTLKGQVTRDDYHERVATIESRWQERFGKDTINTLLSVLEIFVGDPAQKSPLFRGLEPYPDNWRAKVRQPDILPHFPMVLHRGGYPDGS